MLDETTIPDPAGLRSLTPQERKQRADAMACLDSAVRPGTSDCSQNVWISIYFDGTGNNRNKDTPKKKNSALLLADRGRCALLEALRLRGDMRL